MLMRSIGPVHTFASPMSSPTFDYQTPHIASPLTSPDPPHRLPSLFADLTPRRSHNPCIASRQSLRITVYSVSLSTSLCPSCRSCNPRVASRRSLHIIVPSLTPSTGFCPSHHRHHFDLLRSYCHEAEIERKREELTLATSDQPVDEM
ncbi:hypothetical protein Sjap_018227 [Stephania japonica]|uniref:Uncharacterized protein n=1 Tax=Stephania japonica TaxID=461633 RepID=A0AAP0NJ49_9MAGN